MDAAYLTKGDSAQCDTPQGGATEIGFKYTGRCRDAESSPPPSSTSLTLENAIYDYYDFYDNFILRVCSRYVTFRFFARFI